MTRHVLRLLAAAALSAAALAVPITTASAVDGPLTFYPGTGSDATPMWVVTAEPCPAAAQAIIGTVVGPGFPAEGYVVLSNTKAGLDYTKPMALALQDTFNGFAANSGGIKLAGKYTVAIRCIDRLGATTFATFAGTVTFTNPKKYTAPAAVITEVPKDTGGIDGGPIPGQSANPGEPVTPAPATSGATGGDPSAAPTSGSATGAPAPESSVDPAAPAAEPPLAGTAAGQERDGGSSSPVQVLALVIGAALLLGGLLALLRGSRRGTDVDAAPLDELVPTHADGK